MPELIELELLLPDVLELRVVKPPAELPADIAMVIAGKPGTGAGAAYTHTQASAAAVWTVAHNLGRWPSVTVTDQLKRRIEPDVDYLDENFVRVTHGAPLIGYAFCN